MGGRILKAHAAGQSISQTAQTLSIPTARVWETLRSEGIEPQLLASAPPTIHVPLDPFKRGYLAGVIDGQGPMHVRRVAGQEHHPALAPAGGQERVLELAQLRLPPDQDRTEGTLHGQRSMNQPPGVTNPVS